MYCKPCIEAILHLNALYKKYKDDGLIVLGVNLQDNLEKKKERILRFLDHTKVDYLKIFVDKKVDKKDNVSGYPTFYIIDRNGRITYSGAGYGKGTEKELKKVL